MRNEIFEGDKDDKRIIQEFLENKRLNRPARLNRHITPQKARKNTDKVDWLLFNNISVEATTYFKKLSSAFDFIPINRYYVVQAKENSIGGFFGRPVGGYFGCEDVGFATLVNDKIIESTELRTLELARDYIHDSVHASTFRTFRVGGESGNDVYRYQYGYNFRTAERIAYSSKELTNKSPHGINLNL